jgi:dihydrofolate reductase
LLVCHRQAIRKIRIIEHISLDGVIQAPGGPAEDGDYPCDGWTMPHADPAVGEVIVAARREAFDLLLGRRTYDIWSGYWPKPEKVRWRTASTRRRSTSRPTGRKVLNGPVEGLGRDIVEGVRRITAKAGPT